MILVIFLFYSASAFPQSANFYEIIEEFHLQGEAFEKGENLEGVSINLINLHAKIRSELSNDPKFDVNEYSHKWLPRNFPQWRIQPTLTAYSQLVGRQETAQFTRDFLTLVGKVVDEVPLLAEEAGWTWYIDAALNEILKQRSNLNFWFNTRASGHLCNRRADRQKYKNALCSPDDAFNYYKTLGKSNLALEWARIRLDIARAKGSTPSDKIAELLLEVIELEILVETRKQTSSTLETAKQSFDRARINGPLRSRLTALTNTIANWAEQTDQKAPDQLVGDFEKYSPKVLNQIFRLFDSGKLTSNQVAIFQRNISRFQPEFLEESRREERLRENPGCAPIIKIFETENLTQVENQVLRKHQRFCPPIAQLTQADAGRYVLLSVSFGFYLFDETTSRGDKLALMEEAISKTLLVQRLGMPLRAHEARKKFWKSRSFWPAELELEVGLPILEIMLQSAAYSFNAKDYGETFSILQKLNDLAEKWLIKSWNRNSQNLGQDHIHIRGVLRQSLQYWMLLSSHQKTLKHRPIFEEAFKAAQLSQLGDVSLSIQAGLRQSVANNANSLLQIETLEQSSRKVEHFKAMRDEFADAPLIDGFELALSKAKIELSVSQQNARQLLPLVEQYSQIAPVSIGEIKQHLKPGEAFLFFLPVGNGTAAFFSTSTTSAFYSIGIPAAQMDVSIAALRKGLDPDNVKSGRYDFDPVLAHTLYQHLFGPLSEIRKKIKHFLIVAEGGLASLPLQVLLKSPPTKDAQGFLDLKNLDWFVKHHAVTTLTSPRNLVTEDKRATSTTKREPLIGFGDPIFRKNKQNFSASGNGNINFRAITPDQLVPLPETRHELKTVASLINASEENLFFGESAAESVVKSLSNANQLDDYSIIYFATHGALPGELDGFVEPGLVMTQPRRANPEDDGFLSASEIAALKLDADWVILSACNTAGQGQAGNQSLSGIAKAFFKAGARSLLVSHWEVVSQAAVELTGEMFKALGNKETESRTEALRLAMVRVMNDTSNPAKAHPAYWAPFAIVSASVN